jgi:hypothetical protein
MDGTRCILSLLTIKIRLGLSTNAFSLHRTAQRNIFL